MFSSWIHLGLFILTLLRLIVSSETCLDGSILLCSDGSKPHCGALSDSACPKACDPHHNDCDATAPTCIFPDPKVNKPRGACACRPGYKATGFVNTDSSNQWRLPVEAQEHRVWVAENVKCDTPCDTPTGVESCLEITLLAAECIGTGTAGYNGSQQSMPNVGVGYGNYSQSLNAAVTGNTSEMLHEPTLATEATSEDFGGTTINMEDPDEIANPGDFEDAGETQDLKDDVLDQPSSSPGHESMITSEDLDQDVPEGSVLDEDNVLDDPGEPSFDADDHFEGTREPDSAAMPVYGEQDESTSAEDVPLASDASSEPSIEARDQKTPWPQVAQEKGRERYEAAWNKSLSSFSKTVAMIDVAHRPELCSVFTRSAIHSCKRGVRAQVASCKQLLKTKIAKCKSDLKAKIDKCKRSKKDWWDIRKADCEKWRPEIPKCELARLDIPFCEFDRLTSACCEATRTQAKAMCTASISAKTIQGQIQSIQAACSIGTGLAKAATKSYFTGQLLGVISQLDSVKDFREAVQAIRKAEQTAKDMEKWADALAAAAEGKVREAQSVLGSLIPQTSPAVGNALKWADAVTKKVDATLMGVISAAGELQAIQSAKKTIEALATVANDLHSIQAAARECARVPADITPGGYQQWKHVKSEQTLVSALEAYEQKFSKVLEGAAKCQAVVMRTKRVLQT